MRSIIYILLLMSLFIVQIAHGALKPNISATANPTVETHLQELSFAIKEITFSYAIKYKNIDNAIAKATTGIAESDTSEEKLYWLLEKDRFKDERALLLLNEASDISKIRYIKGIQIIKILYEKTLALDHHFASVSTFSEINKIANPNNYPEFSKIKETINDQKDKKEGFNLTSILGNNIYASVAHSLISLFNTDGSKAEKEDSLKEVECILDFTLRMHNDLNTIYFETVFLQKSNDNIMKELQQLFVDFTKPINYKTALKETRNKDNWDAVYENLEVYLEKLDTAMADDTKRSKAHKMQINLEFSIDRLLQFITQYNAFIDQGGKFYEKFEIMLNSYENQTQCESKIPIEYKKLKDGVAIAVEKFKTAYKPVEVNGSKMKEILYGINEYD